MDYVIVFLPLLGSFISGFFGKKIGDKFAEILTSSFVCIAAILSKLKTSKKDTSYTHNNVYTINHTLLTQNIKHN